MIERATIRVGHRIIGWAKGVGAMKRTFATLVALSATVAVAGCSGTQTKATAPTATVTVTAAPKPTPAPTPSTSAPSESFTAPANSNAPVQWGHVNVWKDGLGVSVSQPSNFKPSSGATGAGKYNFIFTVTIVNKTGAAYEPRQFQATALSGNAEAESIFDAYQGVPTMPQTMLLDGRELKMKVAFAVANPDDITVQVTPGFNWSPALFTR